MSALVRDCQQL